MIVNGVTSGQGNYYISSGATLGGKGTIGLAAGKSVFVSNSPGTISPGDAGPGYVNPVNSALGPTFSQGQDGATVGTLSVSTPVDTDVAVDLSGGVLQIDIVDPATYDVLQALNGQIDITNAVLNINGKDGSVSNPYEDLDFSEVMGDNGSAMFTILSASDGVLGSFVNFPGATFLDASSEFYVTFGQDENSVFISLLQTPEPTTIVLWSTLGALGLVFAWRQRKRVR